MKKFLTILTAAVAIACSKSEPLVEYGKVSLLVEQGSTIFIDTKAPTVISDDYQIKITNNSTGNVEKSGTYGTLKGAFTLPVATYRVDAENCSVQTSETANANWGQPRYAGFKEFSVAAGSSQDVTFQCAMANSKVSVSYDVSFTTQFTNYSVTVYTSGSRQLTFTDASTLENPAAYFAPATLTVGITGTNLANAQKSYTQTIVLEAKTWHKLTIKASTNQGSGNLNITVDDTIAEIINDVTVNPYE